MILAGLHIILQLQYNVIEERTANCTALVEMKPSGKNLGAVESKTASGRCILYAHVDVNVIQNKNCSEYTQFSYIRPTLLTHRTGLVLIVLTYLYPR